MSILTERYLGIPGWVIAGAAGLGIGYMVWRSRSAQVAQSATPYNPRSLTFTNITMGREQIDIPQNLMSGLPIPAGVSGVSGYGAGPSQSRARARGLRRQGRGAGPTYVGSQAEAIGPQPTFSGIAALQSWVSGWTPAGNAPAVSKTPNQNPGMGAGPAMQAAASGRARSRVRQAVRTGWPPRVTRIPGT